MMSSAEWKEKRLDVSPPPVSLSDRRAIKSDSLAKPRCPSRDPQPGKNSKPVRKAKNYAHDPVKLDGSNWLNANNHEALLAAYVGFKDTSELRRFATSWPCLAAENHLGGLAKGLMKKFPFELLSQRRKKIELMEVRTSPLVAWPTKPLDGPKRQHRQKSHIVAWCLLKLAADTKLYNMNTDEENMKRTKAEQARFLERHKDQSADFDLKFPRTISEFPRPNLGPLTDKGELELEVYNRCWEVLRYLAAGFLGENWADRFGTSRAINSGIAVDDSHIPHWMKSCTQEVLPTLGRAEGSQDSHKSAIFEVIIHWEHRADMAGFHETEVTLRNAKKRQVRIPPATQVLPWDPRSCPSVSLFRDRVRRFLGCQDLGLDIQSLRLNYSRGNSRRNDEVNALSQDWDSLKEILSTPNNSDFILRLRLQPYFKDDPFVKPHESPNDPTTLPEGTFLFNPKAKIKTNPQRQDFTDKPYMSTPAMPAVLNRGLRHAKPDSNSSVHESPARALIFEEEQIAFYDECDG